MVVEPVLSSIHWILFDRYLSYTYVTYEYLNYSPEDDDEHSSPGNFSRSTIGYLVRFTNHVLLFKGDRERWELMSSWHKSPLAFSFSPPPPFLCFPLSSLAYTPGERPVCTLSAPFPVLCPGYRLQFERVTSRGLATLWLLAMTTQYFTNIPNP